MSLVLFVRSRKNFKVDWHCSTARCDRIDQLLSDRSLECPREWVQPFPVFGRGHGGTPKIAESLWHLSDAGMYVLLLTDINNDYLVLFCKAVRVLSQLLNKCGWGCSLPVMQLLLNEALGELEIKLPIYWCTSVRHHTSEAPEKQDFHGQFPYISMLPEETFHIIVRKLATHTNHTLSSIALNFNIQEQAQNWRLESQQPTTDTMPFLTQPMQSTFAGARRIPERVDDVVPGKTRRGGRYRLSSELFEQLLYQWAIQDVCFHDMMLCFFDDRDNGRTHFGTFQEYWSDVKAEQQSRRCGDPDMMNRAMIENRVTELRSFELDGYYFTRYRPGLKTDNSCVICEYFNAEKNEVDIAYGRIKLIFSHSLWPGGGAPSKVWLDCKWYEKVGIEPTTGLTRIRRNRNFDAARLTLASHVLPISCAFWNERPFDESCDTFLVILQRDRDPMELLSHRSS